LSYCLSSWMRFFVRCSIHTRFDCDDACFNPTTTLFGDKNDLSKEFGHVSAKRYLRNLMFRAPNHAQRTLFFFFLRCSIDDDIDAWLRSQIYSWRISHVSPATFDFKFNICIKFSRLHAVHSSISISPVQSSFFCSNNSHVFFAIFSGLQFFCDGAT
jgi:hypothetical protein